jgi:hypothetical protein
MAQLNLTLTTRVLKSQPSAAGDSVYQGGDVHDGQKMVGTFAMIMDTITTVTNVQGMDTSVFTLQLFLPSNQSQHGHGGGGGGGRNQAPETIVLEGSNEFDGSPNQAQPKQTDRAIGSVAAATPQFASHIGKQFTLQGNNLKID